MQDIKTNTGNLIAKIYEYQKHIGLSRRFIRELSEEGADTTNLEMEILELEQKISDLKLMCGYPLI